MLFRSSDCVGDRDRAAHEANLRVLGQIYADIMTRDEAILIKNYDSAAAELGVAPYSLHTAFEDPTSPPDAAPRESLETRALGFFD